MKVEEPKYQFYPGEGLHRCRLSFNFTMAAALLHYYHLRSRILNMTCLIRTFVNEASRREIRFSPSERRARILITFIGLHFAPCPMTSMAFFSLHVTSLHTRFGVRRNVHSTTIQVNDSKHTIIQNLSAPNLRSARTTSTFPRKTATYRHVRSWLPNTLLCSI